MGFAYNGLGDRLFQIAHGPDDMSAILARDNGIVAPALGKGKPVFPAFITREIDTHAFFFAKLSTTGNIKVRLLFSSVRLPRSRRLVSKSSEETGAPGWIRTSGLKIRSLVLYPAELRARGHQRLCNGAQRRKAKRPPAPGLDPGLAGRMPGARRVRGKQTTRRLRASLRTGGGRPGCRARVRRRARGGASCRAHCRCH